MGWHKENGKSVHTWGRFYKCQDCFYLQSDRNDLICEKCTQENLKSVVARWVDLTTFFDVLCLRTNRIIEERKK